MKTGLIAAQILAIGAAFDLAADRGRYDVPYAVKPRRERPSVPAIEPVESRAAQRRRKQAERLKNRGK